MKQWQHALLNTLVYLVIILLTCNVKSEDTCMWLRPKYGVSIDTDKCQFENFTMEQGMIYCVENCDHMPELRKFLTLHYYLFIYAKFTLLLGRS